MAPSLLEQEDQACKYAQELVSISVLPMTLKAALQLGVLDILHNTGNSMTASELASMLNTNNPSAPAMLDRMLRLLASYDVVEVVQASDAAASVAGDEVALSQRYKSMPVCKWLIKNENHGSVGPLGMIVLDKVYMESSYYIKDGVLNGGVPFEKAFGMQVFQYHGTDKRFNELFNDAMKYHSTIIIKKVIELYDGFKDIKVLVDVGGGTGIVLHQITSQYSHIKGINYDLPHVIKEAPVYPGVQHVVGDMFQSVPNDGDAILLKWILHDWGDEHCNKLLKNCYEALPKNGKVIVLEVMIPSKVEDNKKSKVVLHMDMLMFMLCTDGKERTAEEYEVLAKGAGFCDFRATYMFNNFWILEFIK